MATKRQYLASLTFTADSKQAEQAINKLNSQLDKLLSRSANATNGLGLSKDLQQANNLVAQLKAQLNNSRNSMGGLDLSKFNESLKQSNTNLDQYREAFALLGKDGDAAFLQLAQSIASAEIPLRRTGKLTTELWTTLKNTAKWQISSSVLHGFMGAIQTAYGYAQDLNESLNNIRIVTGQSTDQMAKFAAQANKAAKELSTTTTDYTNASLIYYQQGLSDEEVQKRTDVTIKMANAAGVSAELVSDQLTAVWNNFAKGGENLEWYADVMTALGAATASSTSEISDGLEKFAAVADTVGLSYEYATAALATVTATTRQSADVVGTAFRTLFARIQGLNLGETLDDGTDLNKYSAALAKVGIDIKDVNGDIKDMDIILNELGGKWNTLAKDQQIALAETVAGVRQYTQLIALMDNWDYFQENLDVVANASGTLQEQADTYAESWEASKDRVRAAAEEIYSALVQDDFFIGLNDLTEDFLGGISNIIKGLNGVSGVISALGLTFTRVFNQQLSTGIDNLLYSIKMSTAAGRTELQELQKAANNALINDGSNKALSPSTEGILGDVYQARAKAQAELEAKSAGLSQIERDTLNILQQQNDVRLNNVKAIVQEASVAENAAQQQETRLRKLIENANMPQYKTEATVALDNLKGYINSTSALQTALAKIGTSTGDINKVKQAIGEASVDVEKLGTNAQQAFRNLQDVLANTPGKVEDVKAALNDLDAALITDAELTIQEEESIENLANALVPYIGNEEKAREAALKFAEGLHAAGDSQVKLQSELAAFNSGMANYIKYLHDARGASMSWGQAISAVASGLMSLATIYNSVKGLGQLWNDEDISLGEKIFTTIMDIGMATSALTQLIFGNVKAGLAKIIMERESIKTGLLSILNIKAETLAVEGLTAADKALIVVKSILNSKFIAMAAVIGAVVGVVALLIKGFKAVQENTPEAKLAKVNEEINQLKSAADGAEAACSELQDTLQNFKDASSQLKDLDQSTLKFQETLKKANDYARELIDAFGLIQGQDWHFGNNGEIIITSDIDDKIKELDRETSIFNGTNTFAASRQESAQASANAAGSFFREYFYSQTGNTGYYNDLMKSLGQDAPQRLVEALQSGDTVGLSGLLKNARLADKLNKQYLKADDQDKFLQEVSQSLSDEILNYVKANNLSDTAISQNANDLAIATGSKFVGQIREAIIKEAEKPEYSEDIASSIASKDLGDKLKELLPNLIDSVDQDDDGNYIVSYANGEKSEPLSEQNIRDSINEANRSNKLFGFGQEVDAAITDWMSTLTKKEQAAVQKAFDNNSANSLSEEELVSYKSAQGKVTQELSDYGVVLEDASTNAFDLALGRSRAAVSEFNSQWLEVWSELKDLAAGDTIDPEIYNRLSENQKQFFAITEDGQYRLIATAEQVKQAFIEENQEKLKSATSQIQGLIANGLDAGASDVWAEHIVNQGAYTVTDQNEGILTDWVNSILGDEVTGDLVADQQAAAQKWLELNNTLDEAERGLANTAQSLNELDNMNISAEAKSNAFDNVLANEASRFGIDTEEVYDYAEYLGTINEHLKENPQLAKRVSLAIKEINNAIEDLSDNFDDYNKILQDDSLEGTEDYSKALSAVTQDIEELTGVSRKNFSKDFFNSKETLAALDDISNGVDGAIERFQELAGQNILVKMGVDQEAAYQTALAMDDFIAQYGNIEIGATVQVDDSQALAAFQDLLNSGAITVDQLQSYFDDFGFEPEVTWEKMTAGDAKRSHQTAYIRSSDGTYTQVDSDFTLDEGAEVWVPHLKSATKKRNTAAASAVANRNNATLKPATSKGGGGSSSQRKAPEKKNASDEIDRYHVVKNQLEDLQDVYDDTSDAADRLFGQARVDKIEDSIKATDDLIKKQKEYLAQIQANLPIDRAVLSAYYKDLFGGDIAYDELGNISNYEEIMNKALETYNRNTDILGEEDWNVFEKKYEQFKKYLDQYEETYDLLREEENNLQELINQRIDAQLEKIQYEIELKINTADDGLALLEYQLNNLDDKAFAAAEAIELFSEKAELIYDKIAADREGLERVLGETLSGAEIQQVFQGNFDVLNGRQLTENQASAIQQYRDDLLDLNEELAEVRDEMGEKLMQVFDDFNEKLQEGIDKFDHYNSVMENFRNIVDIVGQDYLGITNDMLKGLDQAMVDNAINKVSGTKDAYDSLMAAQTRAQAAYEDALRRNSQDDILYWQQVLYDIGAEVESAQENWMQAWEDALDSAREIFEANVERAIDDFEKALLPFGDMEQFSDAYDKQQELADQYLDDYQKIYELSKLARDVNNSIDDTDNIAGKQKLKDLLDKINKAQEDGVELSQYDLEYLQKEYDLRMAEIAMEEAQNAKNTVRLTRDNEGNWSYTYTNDSDMAADTAQKYEDALYAMQELSSNYVDEMSDQLISTSKEMEEALAAVRVEDYASIEEYYKRLDEIQSYYLERMKYMQSEMQKALDNNKDLYEQDWQRYHDATGYKISDNDKFAMSYQDTVLGSLMGSEDDIVDFTDKLKDALGDEMGGLIGNLLFSYQEWADNTDRAMEAAGTSTDKFAEDMQDAVSGPGGISEQSAQATDSVEDMANQMVSGFDSVTSAVESWQKHYSEAMEKVIKDNLAMIESFNALLSILSGTIPDNLDMEQLRNYLSSPQGSLSQGGKQFSDASSFDSGGYTGSWGPNGRMAILHQKELVLNQQDTENLLSSVELLQQISKVIDLNTLSAGAGLGNIGAATARAQTGSLQQEVSITAEFPNATDHNEIELAMRNLINTAAQYANRK